MLPDRMPVKIKFGTDGWRGLIAEDFTFDNVRLCAQAVADYLKVSGLASEGLIVGYDTRFASEHFAAAAAEVTAGNGIKTYLCQRATPTPVVSYGIKARKVGGAIIITASHNPALWNGFKVKTEKGTSLPQDDVVEIENRISAILSTNSGIKRTQLSLAVEEGTIEYLDLASDYLLHLASLVDLRVLRDSGLNIIVDSMYGAGAGYLKKLLMGGKSRVSEINGVRNPLFPNIRPEPIAPNLERLSSLIKREKADVGLATDGDADRLGVIDDEGSFLTPLQVFALLSLYLLEARGFRGPLVKTITTGSMLYKLGDLFGVPVYETPVGFKYVAPKMMAVDALVGGEESGGYGFRGHVPDRDGILSGLYFLDLMVRLKKSPSQLIAYLYSKVGPHYYQRLDLEFPAEKRQEIVQRVATSNTVTLAGIRVLKMDTLDGFRFHLSDGSWFLIRFSGTEPVLRIYAESDNPQKVETILRSGRDMMHV